MTRTLSTISAAVFAAFLTAAAVAQPPAQPQAFDLTPAFRGAAQGVANLRVYEVGGIVLIRGRATDRAAAEQLGVLAQNLGYTRVANLVQIVTPPDDAALRLAAERTLALHRLDGAKLNVDSKDGVLRVSGNVTDQTQKDAVIAILRQVEGVRDVQADWRR